MSLHFKLRCTACGHTGTVPSRLIDAMRADAKRGMDSSAYERVRSRLKCNNCGKKGEIAIQTTKDAGTTTIDDAGSFVGAGLNVVSDPVFHRPSCLWVGKMNVSELVTFATREQAEFRGYRPCRVCKP